MTAPGWWEMPRPTCGNSELGWMNQECGKPSAFIATKKSDVSPSGLFLGSFCARCRESGRERHGYTDWRLYPAMIKGAAA